MNKSLGIVLAGIVVMALGIGGAWYFFAGQPLTKSTSETNTETPTESTTPTTDQVPQFVQSSPDLTALQAGGSSYLDPQGLYSFLYPNDYELDAQNVGMITRIVKRGETQRGQTEIYDGALVVFETVDLQGKSLEEYATNTLATLVDSGTSEVLKPLRPVKLGEFPGYTYETRGLGSQTSLVVQKDLSSPKAVHISFLVADPEQKNYQAEVDAVLSTFKLLK